MSHQSKIFTSIPVEIPNKSGFDLSHENLMTMKVGTLTPILTEELLPGDSVSLNYLAQVSLPPMATDFFGDVDLRIEAFFVPNRILWAGWQRFITLPMSNPFYSSADTGAAVGRAGSLPIGRLTFSSTSLDADYLSNVIGPGTLADYLGFKFSSDSISTFIDAATTSSYLYFPNLLPFMAYHKIYDEWYRDSRIQTPAFGSIRTNSNASGEYLSTVGNLPYDTVNSNNTTGAGTATLSQTVANSGANRTSSIEASSSNQLVFYDGVDLFSLRQRNFSKDYFTTAHLYPSSNDSLTGVQVDVSGDYVTIPDLRSANVLQRWIDRNNIAGVRYSDQIKATFGVSPSDAVIDRPIFLGSSKFSIYNKSVYQTSNSGVSESTDQRNPFDTVGSSAAAAKGSGKDNLVSSFTATEHGYLMVLASIVPRQFYSSGSRRYLYRCRPYDFANPLLQGLGEQAIFDFELSDYYLLNPAFSIANKFSVSNQSLAEIVYNSSDGVSGSASSNVYDYLNGAYVSSIFGYSPQYSEYKYHEDEVHGLLRSGENLEAFALQSNYQDAPELSSEFLQIPTDYLDGVTAVADSVSNFGAWCDFFLNLKKVSTLSEYVIPTLGDLKNTHKENIPYNGTRL